MDFKQKFFHIERGFIRKLLSRSPTLLNPYIGLRNLVVPTKRLKFRELHSTEELKQRDNFILTYESYFNEYNLTEVSSKLKGTKIFSPSLGVYQLNNVTVNRNYHTFIYNDMWYHSAINSLTCSDLTIPKDFLIYNDEKQMLSVELPIVAIEFGIFLGGHFAQNWFHWTWEIVSKLSVLKHSNVNIDNYKLCVPSWVTNFDNHLKLLEAINPNLEIVYMSDSFNYHLISAIIVDSPLFEQPVRKKSKECLELRMPSYSVNNKAIADYRDLLLRGITDSSKKGKRIFLARKKANRSYNQDEVFSFFKAHEFEIFYPEEHDFFEQMEVFYHAEMIVGPTGAAFSNLLFCRPETKVFIWSPFLNQHTPVYAITSLALGLKIKYAFFDTEAMDWFDFAKNFSYKLTEEFLNKETRFLFEN